MKILIVTPILPWPLNEGGRVAQFRTLEALQAFCNVTLLFPAHCVEQENDAILLQERLPSVRIVPVRCYEPPQPPPPPPKPTFRRFLGRIIQKMFPAPKTNSDQSSEYGVTIKNEQEPSPYYPFQNLHPNFVEAVDKELGKGYDIFQAEFCNMLSLGLIVGKRAKRLFIHHQLHWVYSDRFLRNLKMPSVYAMYLVKRMRFEERAFLENFDAAIVFSEIDAGLLREFSPGLQVEVSPFPSPEDAVRHHVGFQGEISDFLFIASEVHKPNTMGLNWFMEEVWLQIKARLPNARMSVVGKWSEIAKTQVPHFADIDFVGFVSDLKVALRDKIMVVPIWIGSGIRTKILAAWSCGTPVVSTTIGAEGLHGDAGKHFLIADDPNEFAQSCLELAVNVEKRNSLIRNGLENLQQHYTLDAVKDRRLEIYQKLVS